MDKNDLHIWVLFECNACVHGKLMSCSCLLLFLLARGNHMSKMDNTLTLTFTCWLMTSFCFLLFAFCFGLEIACNYLPCGISQRHSSFFVKAHNYNNCMSNPVDTTLLSLLYLPILSYIGRGRHVTSLENRNMHLIPICSNI